MEKSGQTGTLLAEAYDLARRMGPYGQKGLSEALGIRKLGGGFNETDFLIGYIDVYLAALKGTPHGPVYLPATVDSHARRLSLVERMQAYHNGLNDAKARTQTAQSVNPETGIPQAASQPIDSLIADIRAKDQGTKKIAPPGVEKLDVVDDADPAGYNITKMEKGAVTDGAERRTQLDGAAGEGIREELPGYYQGETSRRLPGQGDLRTSGCLGLSDQSKQILQQRGVVTVDMEISADKAAFSHLLDEARVADIQNGWAVTPKTAEELAECRTFISADGGVGFAIAPDGDIEAVFRNRGRHQAGQAMKSAIPQAVAAGGTKLDCYGRGLVQVYAHNGFVPVARVTFNPEFANPGWTVDKGTPDIYVMMATDTDPDVIIQKQGSYHYWTGAELAALPLMEYDEAMAYRDRLLAEQLSSKGSSLEIRDGAPNSVGAAAEGPMVPRPVDPLIADIRARGAGQAAAGEPEQRDGGEVLHTDENKVSFAPKGIEIQGGEKFEPKQAVASALKRLEKSSGLSNNISMLKLYAQTTDFVVDKKMDGPIGYDLKADVIVYNPQKALPYGANRDGILFHELSHRAATLAYGSLENSVWDVAIKNAEIEVMRRIEEIKKWFDIGGKYRYDPFFSDIISALSRGKVSTLFSHEIEEWESPFIRSNEIFANIATIDALGLDRDRILDGIYEAFKAIIEGGVI